MSEKIVTLNELLEQEARSLYRRCGMRGMKRGKATAAGTTTGA